MRRMLEGRTALLERLCCCWAGHANWFYRERVIDVLVFIKRADSPGLETEKKASKARGK